ncbi:MAG: homoserine kinase [Pseudomonadota bacterium]|nr:homoserine kinase [Pseudomonadota bacterium]
MAVYTHVDRATLAGFLDKYAIGSLTSFEGVREGVENTNYSLVTDQGRYFLTLFEKRVAESDLPYFLDLMANASRNGVPAPAPIPDKRGVVLQRMLDRPAVIISFLEGKARMKPSVEDCRAAGAMLARLHNATADFKSSRANALGPKGWNALAVACAEGADRCAHGLQRLIGDSLANLDLHWPKALPVGQIHADLFPDNVFFSGDEVSGVIDFYFACTDFLAYDLAITLNSWCFVDRAWRPRSAAAMIEGYKSIRPLRREEVEALPTLMRGGAIRFLLTRLYDWLNQDASALVTVKDPLEYRDLLLFLEDAAPESLYAAGS